MIRFFLAFLLCASTAAAAEPECLAFGKLGCLYVPRGSADTLLIYLRGHHPKYKADVPRGETLASARQAFEFYGLKKTADAAGVAVLVTGRSGLAVSRADVEELGSPKIVIAAHSGGVAALRATLREFPKPARVVLLDMFYGEKKPKGDQLTPLGRVALAVQRSGAPCAGFYTGHNERRFKSIFAKGAPNCAVEGLRDHQGDVNRCLASYLSKDRCAP